MASDETPGPGDGPPPGSAGPPAAGSRVAGYRLQEQIGRAATHPVPGMVAAGPERGG